MKTVVVEDIANKGLQSYSFRELVSLRITILWINHMMFDSLIKGFYIHKIDLK